MPTATALVSTDRPQRYIKQLVSHFGAKVDSELTDDGGSLRFPFGTSVLTATDAGIEIRAEADSAEDLERLQDVVARHLVRFGSKDELAVDWASV